LRRGPWGWRVVAEAPGACPRGRGLEEKGRVIRWVIRG